jgi:hypothetical protein
MGMEAFGRQKRKGGRNKKIEIEKTGQTKPTRPGDEQAYKHTKRNQIPTQTRTPVAVR